MMKRSLFSIILLLLSLFSISAVTEYSQNIPVSFTFDIVANYGFSSKKVSDFIQPEGIKDDSVYFRMDTERNKLISDDFYVFYQIFTPKSVKITLSVGKLKSDGKTDVSFSSRDGYDFISGTSNKIQSGREYTILNSAAVTGETFTPYFNSYLLSFVIDDISKVDWDADYTAVLTLKMVVTE